MSNSTPQVSDLKSRATVVPALALRLGLGLLRRWHITAIALLGCTLGIGALSIFLLLRQPPKPQCESVFWPFASGSLRMYCAQERSQKGTLEDLFEAIGLVDALSSGHPLRPLINRWIDLWSKQALDLAEEEFHQGNLEKAIEYAKKIPAQTTAHRLVQQRITYWNTVWAKGKGIFSQAEKVLNDEDWRQAFGVMVGLLSVDNRYWSEAQYEALNQRIINAQKDETQLAKAQNLFSAGGLENLDKALDVLAELSDQTIFKKSIQKLTAKIAKSLVSLAEDSLNREDLNTALSALEKIPKDVSIWPEVQDWMDIAQAISDTWAGDVVGYESAISQLKKISPDRPLYAKTQDLVQKWTADIAYVRLLEEAQAKAADDSLQGLTAAIEQASGVPSNSSQWEHAQQLIENWSSSLNSQQNQPILDQADELSFKGDPSSLRAAIEQAQRIAPGQPLYSTAQSRIKDWQDQLNPSGTANSRVDFASDPAPSSTATDDAASRNLLQEAQRLADKNTPSALASAIETANQIPADSTLRNDAQQAINNWGDQMLNLANRRFNEDRADAIAIAQQIPTAASAYEAAQRQIKDWQGSQ